MKAIRFGWSVRIGVILAATILALCVLSACKSEGNLTAEEEINLMAAEAAESLDADTSDVYDYVDSSESSAAAADYPSTYDLRDSGVVTPVKNQSPWGTCWAFGICAAAETSILSELGTTYEETGLDLSEHHLAWFAKNHLSSEDAESPEDETQEGEGWWYQDQDSAEAANMDGGYPYFGAIAFASGMGAVNEETVPYEGDNGWVEVEEDGSVVDEDFDITEAQEQGYEPLAYSSADDWSLPESDRFEQTYALEENNVLPCVIPEYDEGTDTYALNEDGVNAIKEQIYAGRGVNISFAADVSSPQQEVTSSRYINTDNWAHFTWSTDGETIEANHSVTIVGWDDDYDASNFALDEKPAKWDDNQNTIYMKDGVELENDSSGNPLDPDTGEVLDTSTLEVAREDFDAPTPQGNGAWIVKNSWGSTSEDFPNNGDWGVDGSGYFYISYYDMSLDLPETFDFVVTQEEQEDYGYSYCYEYDYLPVSVPSSRIASTETSMANVFTAEGNCSVNGLSCETAVPGTHVLYQVYTLDDDNENPADGTLVSSAEATYEYGGYHRIQLDQTVDLEEGQRFSVVVTESFEDAGETKYTYNDNHDLNEEGVEAAAQGDGDTEGESAQCWVQGVVNTGESYLGVTGTDGMKWIDWADYLDKIKNSSSEMATYYDFDNLNIKAYANPIEESETNE